MAFVSFIPKIEWLKNTVVGTTAIGSDNVSAVSAADIAKLQVGMFVEGVGVPSDTTITVIGADNFDISANATAAGSPTLAIGFRITFELPPAKDPLGEDAKFIGTDSVSRSGLIQTVEDHIELTNKVNFSHIKQSLKDEFNTFLTTHCLQGKSFSYFEDKEESTSELIVRRAPRYRSPKYKIMTTRSKTSGKNFVWKFTLEFRRVL